MSLLRIGMRGNDVKRLQLLLQSALPEAAPLAVDGSFGPATLGAVKAFQRSRGLVDDGVVGPRTWQALGQNPKAPAVNTAGADLEAPWMAIAKAELGVQENSLPGKHSDRILEYHAVSKNLAGSRAAAQDETPWCSSFVNWVLRQAGYRGTEHALASSWLDWKGGEKLAMPRYGAITVIKKKGATKDAATGSATGNHVAFFVSVKGDWLRLLGGNQGNQVRYSNFSLKHYEVRAHLWPSRKAIDPRKTPDRLGKPLGAPVPGR